MDTDKKSAPNPVMVFNPCLSVCIRGFIQFRLTETKTPRTLQCEALRSSFKRMNAKL